MLNEGIPKFLFLPYPTESDLIFDHDIHIIYLTHAYFDGHQANQVPVGNYYGFVYVIHQSPVTWLSKSKY